MMLNKIDIGKEMGRGWALFGAGASGMQTVEPPPADATR